MYIIWEHMEEYINILVVHRASSITSSWRKREKKRWWTKIDDKGNKKRKRERERETRVRYKINNKTINNDDKRMGDALWLYRRKNSSILLANPHGYVCLYHATATQIPWAQNPLVLSLARLNFPLPGKGDIMRLFSKLSPRNWGADRAATGFFFRYIETDPLSFISNEKSNFLIDYFIVIGFWLFSWKKNQNPVTWIYHFMEKC